MLLYWRVSTLCPNLEVPLIQQQPADIYEWMLLNVHELVAAIEKDGRLDGHFSGPMLEEAQRYDRSGKLQAKARDLLRTHLRLKGLGDLLP